ncbi:MAG: hypothetical protein QOE70_2086 [Chthoniobacter sp.]|jgi:pyruvate/2-oxoglutarate dehydrogenase complex dihydrolipoamide dehydrogenase (E3) component|nr:hypothetical protein [Chthoniobacter sp.]
MKGKGHGVYNVVVIGAGTAGQVTAAGTAGLGGRVALIERNQMGGDCLNFGCVPSKALISSARVLHTIRHAAAWGIDVPPPQPDFSRIFERMRERRAGIAPHDSQERFESLGVDVFRGEARFLSPKEVEVEGVKLRAKHFVIATGTHAATPPIAGLESVRYFTNETIFDALREKPGFLLVLGGGPIGCELAQTFARFGVAVTLVQRGAWLLPREDHAASALLRKALEAEGVTVLTGAEVKSVRPEGSAISATIQRDGIDREEVFDALLLAAGRTPNLDQLNLEAAGVQTTKKGVEVNDYLQTFQPHIYAAGDITGQYLFTHMADYQARIVVRNILMPLQVLRQKADYSVVPWCTYTDPEVARVGLNEEEATRAGIACDVFEQPMAGVDRAILEEATAGSARVLVRKGTDIIVGATIVAEHAGDLLQPLVIAMRHGLGLGQIAATIHPYPTLVEVSRKTGDLYSKTRLTPRAKRIFAWLYARQRGDV